MTPWPRWCEPDGLAACCRCLSAAWLTQAAVAEMPAALRPPTAQCVKAALKEEAMSPPPQATAAVAPATLAADAEDNEEQANCECRRELCVRRQGGGGGMKAR